MLDVSMLGMHSRRSNKINIKDEGDSMRGAVFEVGVSTSLMLPKLVVI